MNLVIKEEGMTQGKKKQKRSACKTAMLVKTKPKKLGVLQPFLKIKCYRIVLQHIKLTWFSDSQMHGFKYFEISENSLIKKVMPKIKYT